MIPVDIDSLVGYTECKRVVFCHLELHKNLLGDRREECAAKHAGITRNIRENNYRRIDPLVAASTGTQKGDIIMSADSLYDNIRSYLRLTVRVVSKHGSEINVDEKFTLRFSGSNSAYAANIVEQPRIIFLNAKVYVQGTEFASVTGGNSWHDLPDGTLWPGESSHVDLEFTAKKNIGGYVDAFVAEKVARVWITADLDQNRFFEIWNHKNVYQEIEAT